MFEKVNPSHPDKTADRIAGAIVDLAYRQTNSCSLLMVEVKTTRYAQQKSRTARLPIHEPKRL